MMPTQSTSKRPVCPSCSKPSRLCFCTRIHTSGLKNSVSVTILQHEREKQHCLNSTRIVKLGLKNLTVATVSDVRHEAQLVIGLMESGTFEKDVKCTDFDQVSDNINGFHSEIGNAVDLGFDLCHSEIGNVVNLGFDQFLKYPEDINPKISDGIVESANPLLKESMSDDQDEIINGDKLSKLELDPVMVGTRGIEVPFITSTISGSGFYRSLTHYLRTPTHWQKLDFNQILASPVAVDAMTKGFAVKKLQKRQLKGSMELEEYEEFELKVPPGSILIYPSQKAIGIDELKRMDFKVKNLIVLDGTWRKARKMFVENPWLNFLPHLKLDVNKASLYSDMRREPKVGYLSTIESLVYALKVVGENPEELDGLLEVFESMVDDQRQCKIEGLKKKFECEPFLPPT